ncbi:MAG: hypothetical protein AABX89_07030 [Candidatus Thermoplasmatota archaeon]
MAVSWGLVIVLVGLAYGALARGKQDKGRLFRKGFLIGLVIAVVLALLAALTGSPALTFLAIAGGLAILVDAIIMSLLFILGVWLGDLISGAKTRAA